VIGFDDTDAHLYHQVQRDLRQHLGLPVDGAEASQGKVV
jgi:hypothetical protein